MSVPTSKFPPSVSAKEFEKLRIDAVNAKIAFIIAVKEANIAYENKCIIRKTLGSIVSPKPEDKLQIEEILKKHDDVFFTAKDAATAADLDARAKIAAYKAVAYWTDENPNEVLDAAVPKVVMLPPRRPRCITECPDEDIPL